MNLEIERKFLITNTNFKKESYQKKYIQQGFLNSDKNRVVRVRIIEEKAYLTIKGVSDKSGTSRFEWEKELSKTEAEALLKYCEKTIISKTRYEVPVGAHLFEVDEFLGANKGLVVAEIELGSEDETFSKPDWLGEEVTGTTKYYNSKLSNTPFCDWN